MNYTGGAVAAENDLMEVSLTLAVPKGLPVGGKTTITISEGADKIRLWKDAHKGTALDLKKIQDGTEKLPEKIYVEGIRLGSATMKLVYVYKDAMGNNATYVGDIIVIDIVTLYERQLSGASGKLGRNVIYNYNSIMSFMVSDQSYYAGRPLEDYEFSWDLNGDGTRADKIYEKEKDSHVMVKYGYGPPTDRTVPLPCDAAHRRQTYTISVELTGGLVLTREVRVDVGDYTGKAVATTLADRRQEVASLVQYITLPTGLSNTSPTDTAETEYSQTWLENKYGLESTPPAQTINAGNRLQYASLLNDAGLTPFYGLGVNTKVYLIMIGKQAYEAGIKQEDLIAVAAHECRHLTQNLAIASGSGHWFNVERAYYDGTPDGRNAFENLEEADAELVSINQNQSWYYLGGQSLLKKKYAAAMEDYKKMDEGEGKKSAKALLQAIYVGIPFTEMYRSDYNWYLEAPE